MISMAKHTKVKQTQNKNSRCKEGLKTLVKSVRMSEAQYDRIMEKANEHELSLGSYMVHTATHSNNGITPELLCKIQNIVNIAHDTIKEYAPEKLGEVESEMNEFWSSSRK